jgi:hypothetical protein
MANCFLKSLLFLSFSLTSIASLSQTTKSGEVGLTLGGTYYLGDINHIPFKSPRIAGGVFYRHNFNTRYSAKGSLNAGFIGGSGDAPNGMNISFNRIFGQLSAIGEFNFLPFIVNKKDYKYSTYLQGGIGVLYYPQSPSRRLTSIFIFDIPMGFGVKYNLRKRFTCGADYIMYKTFNDNLDFKGDIATENSFFRQNNYNGNKDWYAFFGIYLAYKIDYPEKCPAFD